MILPEHLPIGPVSAAAGVSTDATSEEVIERKMHECVRGLRGRRIRNLHALMVGLVEKPLLRPVMRETKETRSAPPALGINRNTLRKKLKSTASPRRRVAPSQGAETKRRRGRRPLTGFWKGQRAPPISPGLA